MGKRMIKITGEYVVANGQLRIDSKPYHTFPSLTRLSDGSFICCFLLGKTKTDADAVIKLFRSTDECRTWREVPSPAAHEWADGQLYGYMMCHVTEIRPGHLIAVYLRIKRTNPGDPLFHPRTDGIQYCEVRTSKSTDNGLSWSFPKTIDYHLPDMIVPGKCIVLEDGVLGIPCEVWKEWDLGFREGPSSRLIFSSDDGETWPDASIMAADEMKECIYGDPRITVLPDGRLVTLFWKYSLKDGKDMPVHRVESTDNGVSWGKPYDTGFISQIASPVSLGSNLMICVYQRRFGNPSLRAILSYDHGLTLDKRTDIAVYESGKGTDDTNPFTGYTGYTFGYSSVIKLSNREVMAVYWCGDREGTSIRISRLEVIG